MRRSPVVLENAIEVGGIVRALAASGAETRMRCKRAWMAAKLNRGASDIVDVLAWLPHPAAMTLEGFPRISIDIAVCGGRPVVTGTRVRVTDVLEMLAGGATPAEIATDFPYVSESDVRAVLAYAASQANHPVVLAAE